VIEEAVSRKRSYLLASDLRIENYGVEDFTSVNEVMRGQEEKYRRLMDVLNELESRVVEHFEERRQQEEELVEKVSKETINGFRRSPEIGYDSLTEELRDGLNTWVRTEVAPAKIKATREALRYAQKTLEQTMYYGQEMVLPTSPFWNTLSADQQQAMQLRHRELERWWNRPGLISYLIYCIAAPFSSLLIALIVWFSAMFTLTAVGVSWYSEVAESFFKRRSWIVIMTGIAILGSATWYLKLNWMEMFGGLVLIGIGSSIVSILLRALFWRIRTALIR